MNRRTLLKTLVGLGAASAASAPDPTRPPLMRVEPHCPRCGNAVWWLEPVSPSNLTKQIGVLCGCGWAGAAARLVPVTEGRA